ncbi:uncharacterized protein LOC111622260 [Centruroides sculpturatus]|uniref:uncharacterized protein LOC111622260 n=1 Tax=Centruroides sculpturatus TaxID=218467 RepID=UPI000C6DBAF3|nr:uncharacterized protein LOC111622260 [Centruroides sculpturatus]
MNNNKVKVNKTLKYLGVVLDHRLSWKQHIEYVTNRTGLIIQSFAQVAKRDWGLSTGAMSIIYDSIYLPIISYASNTWSRAAERVHIKRKLISSQRRALMLITKAYRTASNTSLQVIARKPPLDLYIKQKSKIQQAKKGESIQVDTLSIQHNDVEWPYSFRETNNYIISLEHDNFDTHNQDMDIYTDGSRHDGKVGSSFVVFINKMEVHSQAIRLHERCTIFQAELYAIKKAIAWTMQTQNNIAINIYTDSRSAYNIIYSNILHPLAEDIRNSIRLATCNIKIYWIKAHQGVYGNERADTLAKYAADNTILPIEYDKLSVNTLKRLIWEETIQLWQQEWNQNSSHITYKFIPDLKYFYSIKYFLPNHITTQIFTGHGKYASYLTRFTTRNDDNCPTCRITDGPEHYFYDCIMFCKERLELQLILEEYGIQWPCKLCDIWVNKNVYNAFIKLAESIYTITNQIIYN